LCGRRFPPGADLRACSSVASTRCSHSLSLPGPDSLLPLGRCLKASPSLPICSSPVQFRSGLILGREHLGRRSHGRPELGIRDSHPQVISPASSSFSPICFSFVLVSSCGNLPLVLSRDPFQLSCAPLRSAPWCRLRLTRIRLFRSLSLPSSNSSTFRLFLCRLVSLHFTSLI
jgi:hypothetical protein